MWFKNLQIFRLSSPVTLSSSAMSELLLKQAFHEGASSEMESEGWTSPGPDGNLLYEANGQWLLQHTAEKKLLPSSVVKKFVKVRAAELEEKQGFAPGRKALKDLKEQITEELRPKAFSILKTVNVWIDPKNMWLVIDTPTPSTADTIVKCLLKSIDGFPLESLRVNRSPQSAMTGWICSNEAPKGFTIDQDAELRTPTEDKATVKFARHSLDPDDIQRHIGMGKQCIKLALTWNDKMSFTMTDSLQIRSLKPLNILAENADNKNIANAEERFAGDFVLMAAEYNLMLDDLVFSLDGITASRNEIKSI